MVARERIDVRNGEVIKTKTNYEITNKLWKTFNYIEGAKGPITIQIFYNKKKRSLYGIEINQICGFDIDNYLDFKIVKSLIENSKNLVSEYLH